MKALKHIGIFTLLLLPVALIGCGDEDGVAPPPPPPQLELVTFSVPDLPDNDVYDILVDSQDRIWVCTQNGVGLRIGNQWYKIDQGDGLPNPRTRRAVEFNGKIWIATWGGGIGIFKNNAWITITEAHGLPDGAVFDIAVDDTSIWFGTVNGVVQYRDNDAIPMANRWIDHTSKATGPEVADIEIAEATSRGSEVWFGSKFDWVGVWRPVSLERVTYTRNNSGIPGTGVNTIAYNPLDGIFWVGFFSEGLASVDVDISTWRHYTTMDGLPSMVIHSVAVDDDGVVWVGTQGGLGKLKGDRFIAFTKGSGIPAERVRRVYVDEQNRVWLAFIDGGVGRITR
ncbi:MAG: hypothetical protein GTO51_10280 [Candidatus Latescibacteria bacterium]|nr:hypothetical protein [Candidatus Latescibacterota bacterium]NIM66354.1 hypothetical protein [Candidatus Latescibacterota bacterium]NIO02833.1 hypothetical protein [Candidatus Latescibacterota bacterium]NIO29968.1 hypothetical protein [Candidatus Latescibacterota bacterium]NIO57583.1 hypothetical protein [Candidatus Latescibacterota bacterium]